ncbi:MAG: hypothetical protein GY750_00905 [Lentisphaerae bacterium]|nr:hypothetical protein [Lentisphaerota bacterium]
MTHKVHDTLIIEHVAPRLNCHVSSDSTAIKAREKSCRKNKPGKKQKAKRGRPCKSEVREPKPLRIYLAVVPGQKKDSKNKMMQWKGYKLHIDTIDGDIPVSAILTSASPHDNQFAIYFDQRFPL